MGLAITRRASLKCAVSTILVMAAQPVMAQETAGALPDTAIDSGQPAEGTFLGRIVFGFGLPRVAVDTPQSVSVVDQDDLDRTQAATIGDALTEVPGVQAVGGGSALGQAFNIRGIGLTEQTASEARIIVKVDGAPKFYEQYRMGSFFSDPELYRRVEVLRGPAGSTLYGSGALGGVINFTTKDAADFIPAGETSAVRTRLGYASQGDAFLGSVILANRFDSFETLAALNYRTSEDYEDGDGDTIAATGGTSVSGLLKGTWRFGAAQDQLLRLSFQQWNSDLDDSPLASTGGGAIVDTFGLTDRQTTDRTAVLSYENPIAGNDLFDLRLQMSYSDTRVVQDNHQNTSGSPTLVCGPGQTLVLCDVEYGYTTLNMRAENRAQASGAGWANFLTYGVEYTRIDREAESSFGVVPFHPEGIDEKLGIFLQSELVIGERLTIVPGIRTDYTERTPGDGIPGASALTDTATSPKIAALYTITDNLSVFGSIARTERLPTLDELYSFSGTQSASLDLEKETSDNYELGVAYDRSGLFGTNDSLQFKVTAFRNDVENLIQRSPAVVPTFNQNISSARLEGFEIEGGYEADRIYARLAYATVDAEDTTFGYRLNSNPADSLVVTLGARAPQLGLEYGWRGTFVDDITTASRSTASGAITETDYDGYALHDVYATWSPNSGVMRGIDVNFAVENVLNETWQNNLASDNGRGRNVKLTLTRTF